VVREWLRLDSLLLVGAFVMLPVAVGMRRLRPVALAFGALLLMALRPGYLPQPFVVAWLPFASLVLVGTVERAWVELRARLSRWSHPRASQLRVTAAVVALVLVGVGFVHWNDQRSRRDAFDANQAYVEALHWVEQNVDHRDRVLVDDTFFTDLAETGFRPGLGVVWFYKLDTTTNLDPSVRRALPRGADEFDVVISTPIIRAALSDDRSALGEVRRALERGEVVASFGPRANDLRVDVLRLPDPEGDADGGPRDA
jgi:hypothetical protein